MSVTLANTNTSRDYLSVVPSEVFAQIFQYLKTPQDFINVTEVCSLWKEISNDYLVRLQRSVVSYPFVYENLSQGKYSRSEGTLRESVQGDLILSSQIQVCFNGKYAKGKENGTIEVYDSRTDSTSLLETNGKPICALIVKYGMLFAASEGMIAIFDAQMLYLKARFDGSHMGHHLFVTDTIIISTGTNLEVTKGEDGLPEAAITVIDLETETLKVVKLRVNTTPEQEENKFPFPCGLITDIHCANKLLILGMKHNEEDKIHDCIMIWHLDDSSFKFHQTFVLRSSFIEKISYIGNSLIVYGHSKMSDSPCNLFQVCDLYNDDHYTTEVDILDKKCGASSMYSEFSHAFYNEFLDWIVHEDKIIFISNGNENRNVVSIFELLEPNDDNIFLQLNCFVHLRIEKNETVALGQGFLLTCSTAEEKVTLIKPLVGHRLILEEIAEQLKSSSFVELKEAIDRLACMPEVVIDLILNIYGGLNPKDFAEDSINPSWSEKADVLTEVPLTLSDADACRDLDRLPSPLRKAQMIQAIQIYLSPIQESKKLAPDQEDQLLETPTPSNKRPREDGDDDEGNPKRFKPN